MDFDSAIAAHMQWKVKLRGAIAQQSQLDAASIAKDNVCSVGQWLHGEAKTKYGHLPSHAACLSAHAAFHREAGKIANLINQKHYGQAEDGLANGSPYMDASSEVAVTVTRLRKETV